MKKTSIKTRIMGLVAAAVMTCSVAAVSMASASAATVDTQTVGASAVYGNASFFSSVESKFGSYISLWVWDENGNGTFLKPEYHTEGFPYFYIKGSYVGAKFVRVKGYTEPNWNDGSIMAKSRDYDIYEVLNRTTYLDI